MKKITFAIGILFVAIMFATGSMFSACGSKSPATTGVAGTTGTAGTGTAGTTGAAGNTDAGAKTYSATKSDGKCVSGAFVRDGMCACQPENPLVCSMGCTNKNTDDLNCGGCDAPCGATSTCIAGACGAPPTTVVQGVAGCTVTVGSMNLGLTIAISGTTLYVADANHGKITSQPVAGGAAVTISMAEMAPHALAVNGTTAVWINSVAGPVGDGGLPVITSTLRKSVAGAAPATLATGMNEAGGIQGLVLSADGATVYYSSGTAIMSIPVAGGTPVNVGNEDHGGLPGALALDGTKLSYPTGLNGDVDIMTIMAGTVASCGKNNPTTDELDPALQINCLRVARSQGSLVLTTMLAKANRAYWADGTNLKGNDTGAGAAQSNDNIAQSPNGDIKALAMSADKIYFAHDDVIERTPIVKDSTAVPIARGQKMPGSLALDATKVYWGNNGDCSVSSTGL